MKTGLLVLWLSEQHKKQGCLGELWRQEAPQCLALKEKMCFVNWLTFQTIYLLTGCIVFAKASWKDMQLFKWWFNLQYAADSNSLLGISHELDNMFLSIKVPHDFTREPCSIAELKHWKASEFHLFALFAGLPYTQYAVLSDEFGTDHFYHFSLYCSSFPALSSYFQTLCRGGSSFGW